MKKYRFQLILTSLLALLPLVAGFLLWNQLPDTIATHFGSDNQPNGYSSKAFTVIAIPLFMLAIHWLCLFATLHDPKKANVGRKMLVPLFWMVPALSCITSAMFYANALGFAVNPGLIVNVLIGLIFLLLGNYMGKVHQNYTVGIKLPWTLNSTENWNRTHHLASRCFLAGGLALLVNGWLLSTPLLVTVALICILVPTIYSFCLYKKGI